MSGGKGAGRKGELQLGSAQFAEWRRTRRRVTAIPVERLELSVALAQRKGGSRMSRVLPIGFSEVIASRHSDFHCRG
jgi:hypothetical protein